MEQTPLTTLYSLYERAEAKAAALAEQAVASSAFAELLATTATNALAVAGTLNAVVDRGVRATRVAARADVVGLARQLARTEDKLERVLQEVEALSARLAVPPAVTVPAPMSAPARNGTRVRASR